MLKQLHISNFAIIEEVSVDFEKGFSIITGETGSGKSIILDALHLILGQRVDISMLRDKTKKCVVEAVFDIHSYRLQSLFESYNLDYDEVTIVRREFADNGKSRVFINDTPVTLSQLKYITSLLIDIHAQHETLNINDAHYQIEILDAYAQLIEDVRVYKDVFADLKQVERQLNDLRNKEHQMKSEEDYHLFLFNELEEMRLEEDEQADLESQLHILNHAEEIKFKLSSCSNLVQHQDNNILSMLSEIRKIMGGMASLGSNYQLLFDRIDSSYIELKDIASEVEDMEQTILIDNEKATEISLRLDKIYALQKKHRVNSVKELIDIRNDLEQKIQIAESMDEQIKDLENKKDKLNQSANKLAQEISLKRRQNSSSFKLEIESLLNQLSLKEAIFDFEFKEVELNEKGKDNIEFLFCANKGMSLMPISKVASGGELSRLLLAVKYMISSKIALPTIIFDEIDTGISGAVAEKVANLMKEMANNIQVIAISHLPQTASKANHHYVVEKRFDKENTLTRIVKLSSEERTVEIAKMLSGDVVTEAALVNAKELLS